MADKAISELVEAQQVTATDLFVLQQDNTAKKLSGQTLINYLLRMIDGHGGITNYEKVSTSGLKDTYRFTFADQSTYDLVVTNGRAISSVTQTSVSGLTRTYTIAFNDGSSQQFTVTDGRAITSVKQTSVSGLTRTYTIAFNDGTSQTFTVTDGRSITGNQKTSTSGLVDTYTITYNDGTTSTYTVTNGEKGDQGDNTYLWIKYASQEPTESSHSIGDLPDDWIGIYFGALSAAPSDWTQYAWFKIKGENGDTGDPATLVSATVTYQVGDSGTIIPSGTWGTSIPVVAQGKYLWTRTVQQFNTGNPITAYSVARMGIDGLGSVVSVAGVSPNNDGNVPLTASDVKALPIGGGDMLGPINMNGQTLNGLNDPTEDDEAATKAYTEKYVANAVAGKVDKANVVNNFTTTEEGYVADARALAVTSGYLESKYARVFYARSVAIKLLNIETDASMTPMPIGEYTAIGMLPEEMRPTKDVKQKVVSYNNNTVLVLLVNITASGYVQIFNYTSETAPGLCTNILYI